MRLRTRSRLLAGVAVSTLVALPFVAVPAGAAPTPRATAEVDDAAAWLASQQEADGGFELADFPGFETPDAVLALAGAGQPGPGWDEAAGRAAVEAVQTGGKDPLDAVDDWIDEGQSAPDGTPATRAAQAAKVIALVAVPLDLDATDVDPSDDSTEAVDLVAALEAGAGPDADYAALPFGGRVFAVWALAALDQPVPGPLRDSVTASQQTNGSFSFSGDPGGSDLDPDLTASVVIALTLAGDPAAVPTIRLAVTSLGLTQAGDGEWGTEFDDGNPNSTAMAMLAAVTLGSDPDVSCWRDAADARAAGIPYPAPSASLVARQRADGHIASPNDGFGLNTFATSQATQALVAAEGSWPYAGNGCTEPTVTTTRRLVNAIYADLLGRFGDESGADFWTGQLASDALTPAQFARRATITGEYSRRVVDALYRSYLGRPATLAERTALQGEVAAGRRNDAAAAVLGSEEYFTSTAPVFPAGPPTAGSWVDAVYPAVVGRAADPAGRQFALDQLAAGRTRPQVARTLLGSTEALGVLVTTTYQDLLRRAPDVGGRDYWVGQIRRGQSPERLVLLIAGSSEYVAKTAPAS